MSIDSEALWTQYSGKVYTYFLRRGLAPSDAEDLRSKVFLVVCEKWETYDATKAPAVAWLFGIVRNKALEHMRSLARQQTVTLPDTLAGSDSLELRFLRQERLEQLASALRALPERERDILILRYSAGLSAREVGERMGLSETNVRYLSHKAMQSIKQILDV